MSFFSDQIKRQEQMCDTTLTTPDTVTSINHPNSYLPNSDCRYCVKSKSLGNYVKMTLDVLKLDARRNCYPAKDYILIENWDGSPISSPVCTIIRRNPIKAMSQNAICIKFVSNNKVNINYLKKSCFLRRGSNFSKNLKRYIFSTAKPVSKTISININYFSFHHIFFFIFVTGEVHVCHY